MTQSEVLERVDIQARRALATREKSEVREMLSLYRDAIDEIVMVIAGAWQEMGAAEDAGRRRFLSWKIDQEQRLMAAVEARLDQLNRAMTGSLSEAMVDIYEDQFYRAAYALDQAVPPSIVIDVSGGQPEQADAILATPWTKSMFSDKLWLLTDDMANEIRNQLALSANLGESVAQAKRRIKNLKALEPNVPPDYAIERLARTELLKAADRAAERFHADNEDVIEDEVWMATLEVDRTCEGCAALDGLVIGSEEYQTIVDEWDFWPTPPAHPG